MKITREHTETAYSYLASICPFLAQDATPRFDLVLTIGQNYTDKKPALRGLGQSPLNYEQVLQLREAIDAALAEMDAIERLQQKAEALL